MTSLPDSLSDTIVAVLGGTDPQGRGPAAAEFEDVVRAKHNDSTDELVTEDLIVEVVSIDGMCGVY